MVDPIKDIKSQINDITGGYKPVPTPKDAEGMQGVGITGTDRNVAKEIEAAKLGYSPQYIASRGGINSQGYFNDVPLSGQLTADEQKRVRLPNGSTNTALMAQILQEKQIAEKVLSGMSVDEATREVSSQYGQYGVSSGQGGSASLTGAPSDAMNDAGITGAGVVPTAVSSEAMNKRVSAWATLKAEFDKYNLGSLADVVKVLILDGASADEVTLKLRATPEYKKRFAGNEARRAAGLNVYDEGTYLALENAYAEVFTAYGQQAILGRTPEEKQVNFASYIGGTIAPTEMKRRLQIASDLASSDSATKAALKQLYPMITDSDIVSYILKPSETLPKLEVKAQAAQIGGAFLRQGLATDVTSAEEYAAMGIDKARAEQGAAAVAEVLPRGQFLSEITAGADAYTQQTAEDVYFKGLASAKRAQDQLRSAELARYSGSSGTSRISNTQGTSGLI